MRVLVVSHTYISPVNRDKWKILAKQHSDVQLTIVFPKHWPTCLFVHKDSDQDKESTGNCSFVSLDTIKEGNELLYRYANKQLYNLIKKIRPDIVHVEQGCGAVSYFQIHCMLRYLSIKAKSIFFTWLNWQPSLSLKHRFFFTPIEKINLERADGAIVGNHDAQIILQKKGFKKPILILPQLGVNTSLFYPKERQSRPCFYLGFVGRITEEKGILHLFNAFKKLADTFKQWNLLFIGKGPCSHTLKNLISSHRLQNRIFFIPPVNHEQIAPLLQHIDILVLPSYDTPTWREQFGHVLIEAMACAVPIIGSDAGEIGHVIGSAGLICKQNDEQSLLAQMQTLMQDNELRNKLAKEGYQRFLAQYTHEVIADKTYNFWRHITSYH